MDDKAWKGIDTIIQRLAAYEDALTNPDGTILEPREVAKMLETAFAESCKGKAKIDLLQSEISSLKTERDTLKKDYLDLQCQYEMYGGDEGITGMLEQIASLKSERDVAVRALEMASEDGNIVAEDYITLAKVVIKHAK